MSAASRGAGGGRWCQAPYWTVFFVLSKNYTQQKLKKELVSDATGGGRDGGADGGAGLEREERK